MKILNRFIPALLTALLAACSSTSSDTTSDPAASGTVTIRETQVMALVGGSWGKGTLILHGWQHGFKVEGLKVGGIGVHRVDLHGNVYDLENHSDFEGTYFAAEAGATVVKGVGGFWLKNDKGVTLHLYSSAEGLALNAALEGVKISFD